MIEVDILVCNSLENYLLDNPAGLDWEEYIGGEGGQEGKVDAKVSYHFLLRFDSHLAKQSLTWLGLQLKVRHERLNRFVQNLCECCYC